MNDKKRMRLECDLYIIGWYLLGMGFLLFGIWSVLPASALEKFTTPCMFRVVTGLYCPGCGGTRAVTMLLAGKVRASFWYHPVVPYGAAVYVWYMVSHTAEYLSDGRLNIGMRYRNLYLWAALTIVVLQTVVKNIALAVFHTDILEMLDVVYFSGSAFPS